MHMHLRVFVYFGFGLLLLMTACGEPPAFLSKEAFNNRQQNVGIDVDEADASPTSLPGGKSAYNSDKRFAPESYVDIMPPERMAQYRSLLPKTESAELNGILMSPQTMWYDKESMVPGYQDSMGSPQGPEGMRPNTIQSSLIDTAVPGGHAKLFAARGRFNFPFGTGGIDESDNAHTINFWVPPYDGERILPVAYWELDFSRWRWLFPVGTILGEVLMVRFPDNELRIFEIRIRTRTDTTWTNDIYRPFPTAESLAQSIAARKPNWESQPKLAAVMRHLRNPKTLTPKTLVSRFYPIAWERVDGHLDQIPDIGDPAFVKQLLSKTTFVSAIDRPWKTDGNKVTHAAASQHAGSIVPRNYEAGMFPVTDDFCNRCHQDAGRSIRDFHDQLMAYGELWGEDRTFSWHLFEAADFVKPNGDVKNFNDDNRRLRADFVRAGLVERYNKTKHPDSRYRQLSQSWKYRPI